MATVYLALGSNVGDSRGHIDRAIDLLGSKLRVIKRAPLYRSKAVGFRRQPDFINTAASGETDLEPEELLGFIKTVEEKVGRTKSFRFGPREIDIDIIFYDDLELATEALTIPHPAFRDRDFVLKPLLDLNPRLTDPITGQTVKLMLGSLAPRHKSIIKQVD